MEAPNLTKKIWATLIRRVRQINVMRRPEKEQCNGDSLSSVEEIIYV